MGPTEFITSGVPRTRHSGADGGIRSEAQVRRAHHQEAAEGYRADQERVRGDQSTDRGRRRSRDRGNKRQVSKIRMLF